ncbi:MAG: DUF819 family protein [Bacteroidales bacterium]|nr:DUF819 family protein [Bacteroidales bacterium]
MPRGSDAFREATIGQDRSFVPKSEAVEMVAAGTFSERDLRVNSIAGVQDGAQTALVPLAIPLILFSLNVRRWLKFSGKGFLSMALALVSVMIIVATGYLIFRDKVEGSDKIGGMLIGLYTGGSVNLASIALALDVEPNAFIMTNTYDMIVGALVVLLLHYRRAGVLQVIPSRRSKGGQTRMAKILISREWVISWPRSF